MYPSIPRLSIVCLALLCVAGYPRAWAQGVDQNANGMSDLWELTYGAAGLDPSDDADHDGVSNLMESIAGTDPFDANSAPRISVAASGTNLLITMTGALGKQYELQSIQPIGLQPWTNWVSESN